MKVKEIESKAFLKSMASMTPLLLLLFASIEVAILWSCLKASFSWELNGSSTNVSSSTPEVSSFIPIVQYVGSKSPVTLCK